MRRKAARTTFYSSFVAGKTLFSSRHFYACLLSLFRRWFIGWFVQLLHWQANKWAPGLVNYVTAVANHIYLNLPENLATLGSTY